MRRIQRVSRQRGCRESAERVRGFESAGEGEQGWVQKARHECMSSHNNARVPDTRVLHANWLEGIGSECVCGKRFRDHMQN